MTTNIHFFYHISLRSF